MQYVCLLFAILQKYDFSSKSQPYCKYNFFISSCLRYCKSTIFQANHNALAAIFPAYRLFAILQKYDFSSKSQLVRVGKAVRRRCLRYCKSMIFQANHKWLSLSTYGEWWCAWPSPLAVGRGRCVGYLFGAYYLFLLKCLVSWFYFVSSH